MFTKTQIRILESRGFNIMTYSATSRMPRYQEAIKYTKRGYRIVRNRSDLMSISDLEPKFNKRFHVYTFSARPLVFTSDKDDGEGKTYRVDGFLAALKYTR